MPFIDMGRFVAKPELTKVGDNAVVCKFTLAIDEYRKVNGERKKVAVFLDFEVWDKAAELIAKYKDKGDQIFFNAVPRKDTWEDAEGKKRSKVYFRVNDFSFISNGKGNYNNNGNDSNESSPPDDDHEPF